MTDPDPRLTLPPDLLVARIRELEGRMARYERTTALSAALLAATPLRPGTASQARIGRPRIADLPAQQVAWARAAAPGGAIDQWIKAQEVGQPFPLQIRNSASARIRVFVCTMLDLCTAQTGCRIPEGRREQIVTRFIGYAKAGRALLRSADRELVRNLPSS